MLPVRVVVVVIVVGVGGCCLVVGVTPAGTTAASPLVDSVAGLTDVPSPAAAHTSAEGHSLAENHSPTATTAADTSAAETNGVSAALVLFAFGAVLFVLWGLRRG